ncbi:hypothetical protein PI126_g21508 [Phytophthora idaei]|nr:hypothetical protein PI126_g21508 [Phytophthora idaei]
MQGDRDIHHPPTFMKETMPFGHRAIVEQFDEAQIEATLSADVPSCVPLRKNMSQYFLLAELLKANGDVQHGKEVIARLTTDLKMLYFHGHHTIKFVFHTRQVSDAYVGTARRFQRVVIELEDTGELGAGVYSGPHLRQRYSLHVMCAEREACPDALGGVARVDIGTGQVVLHQQLLLQSEPCALWYSPNYTAGYCKIKSGQLEEVRARGSRVFTEHLPPFQVGAAAHYRPTDADSFGQFWETLAGDLRAPKGHGASSPSFLESKPVRTPQIQQTPRKSAVAGDRPATKPRPVEWQDRGYTIVLRQGAKPSQQPTEQANPDHADRGRRAMDCSPYSYWTPSEGRRGGVALQGCHGRHAIFESHWSPHFMAVNGSVDGPGIILVNVYAPHWAGLREAIF